MRAAFRTVAALGVASGTALRVATALAIAALLAPDLARAGSVFAVGGLGEPSLEESARIRAMGGAGAAEHGPSRFSLVNPASTADVTHLVLEATGLGTLRKVSTTSYGDESPHEASFPSVRLLVLLPGRIVLGGSYLLGTNAAFHVEGTDSAGAASRLTIEGTGGITFARATLARRFTPELRAGIDYEVIGGSYREEWLRVFSDPNLGRQRDTLEVSWERLGRWRFGAQYVRPGFAAGVAYETSRRLPLTERHRTAGDVVTRTDRSLTVPSGYAAGVEASVGSRGRVAAQYRRQSWGEGELRSDLLDLRALERYSLGFELAPAGGRGVFARLPLRVGGTYLRWPDLLPPAGSPDATGGSEGVDEWAASIGTGIRTRDGGGALDLSIEGGSRGDQDRLGARETFLRIALSLRVSDETWR